MMNKFIVISQRHGKEIDTIPTDYICKDCDTKSVVYFIKENTVDWKIFLCENCYSKMPLRREDFANEKPTRESRVLRSRLFKELREEKKKAKESK